MQQDYGRNVLLDSAARAQLIEENQKIVSELERVDFGEFDRVLESGISVIIATYDGADRIGLVLNSLAHQTLDPRRYEVICVVNGKDNGTTDVIKNYQRIYPSISIRQFWQEEGSAGGARNLGLDLARFSRVTFVDDDDDVELGFLETALGSSTGTNIVLSPIINISPDGIIDADNTLNQRIHKLRGQTVPLSEVPWALGFNACKLFPREYARRARYRDTLVSGEDLVYFAELLQYPEIKVTVPHDLDAASYLRYTRDQSVSRQALTFNFAVEQRLACIKALEEIVVKENTPQSRALEQLKSAQAGFVGRYLKENLDEREEVYTAIERSGIRNFPWKMVHTETAKDLAFVYCFAPFSDTSAVVAAKAIVERGRVTDVITNDMSKVRRYDYAVSALADRWIADREIISSPPSFAGWAPICDFAEKALAVAERKHALNGSYENIYSRALWVGSHVAAALFKNKHWGVRWTAEFSDPLRRDAEGQERPGELTDNATAEYLKSCIAARGFGYLPINTLFDLVELVTLVTADELIFTNQNQMDYMLSLYQDSSLQELVRRKSIVRHHPTPPDYAYDLVETTYSVPQDVINIAYFGSFYSNRGIGDVLQALINSRQEVRQKIRVHIFSNKPEEVSQIVKDLGLGPNIYSNPYLSYMEFLNATKLFDVLLVNDVQRDANLPINPFLPSKYSDYLGAGVDILALVDEDSPMSRMDITYKVPVGDVPALISVLEKIVL